MVEEESVDAERTGASLRPVGLLFSLMVAMATMSCLLALVVCTCGKGGGRDQSSVHRIPRMPRRRLKGNGAGRQQDDRDDDDDDDDY